MDWAAAIARLAKAISGWAAVRIEKPTINIITGGNVGSVPRSSRKSNPTKPRRKSLQLDINKLSREQKQQLQRALRAALDDGQTFILDETPEILEGIEESSKSPKNQELQSALQPYLSAADFIALRAAIVLRHMRANRMVTLRMKGDIINKFGDRGAKIANLCSAGYFDNIVAHLKKVQSQRGFDSDAFRRKMDEFISQSAFALFVQKDWARLHTRKSILERIRINAGYGINKLVIHAIGEENIEKVQSITDAILREFGDIRKTKEDEVAGEIRICLEFPSSISRALDN
ncbi:MAG: hypothetical protein KGM24_00310 [Elusimicrobia bacterium]|nr:hypothetical protein [Elusimicrobiota bacterium]